MSHIGLILVKASFTSAFIAVILQTDSYVDEGIGDSKTEKKGVIFNRLA